MSEDQKPKIKDLGYLNGWFSNPPEEFKNCKHKDSEQGLPGKNVGTCLTKYTCEECGFSYLIDSSG